VDKQTTEKQAGEARCFTCFQSTEDKGATLAPSDLGTATEEKDDTETSSKRGDFCLHSPRGTPSPWQRRARE